MNLARFPNRARISALLFVFVAASIAAGQSLAAPEPSIAGFELASLAAPPRAATQTLALPAPISPALPAVAAGEEAAPFELVALRWRSKVKSRCICTAAGEHCACRSGDCADGACRVRPAQPPPAVTPAPEKLVLRRVVVGYRYRSTCGPDGCRTERVPIWGQQYFRE